MRFAALATSLTASVALAQIEPDSTAPPADAQASEAAADGMPLTSSTVLDGLSDAARAEVERICLPVHYQSGAVAYRTCIDRQLDSRTSTPAATVPATSLSFDEEYAIQQTCQSSGPVDSTAYRACDEAQLVSLAGVPEPALDRINPDETYAVQLGCYETQSNAGVKAYRECLNESIGQLLELPRPDLSTLTLVERNALQLRCSEQNNSAVSYRNCLLDAVDNVSETDRSIDSSANLPAVATRIEPEAEATVTSRAIRLPTTESVDQRLTTEGTDAVSDTLDDDGTVSDTPEDTEKTGQTPAEVLTRVQGTIAGMDDMTRMIMWAAIGLPLLLTLFWLLLRSRKSAPETEATYPDYPVRDGVDTAPHRPSSTHRTRMTGDDTAEFAAADPVSSPPVGHSFQGNDSALEFSTQMDEFFGESAAEIAAPANAAPVNKDSREDIPRNLDSGTDTVPTTSASHAARSTKEPLAKPRPDSDHGVTAAKTPVPELPVRTDFTLAPATERDDYLAWLSVQDEARQQTLAIEFLIYWMAYSDERYSPELKTKIFQLQNPGDHDLIKRWTLKQDVHAFAGNLHWLQYNLNTEQHEQIINLLMALLVSENALTPAQNTLLRFLADAFGLGAQRLDALFQSGFAQPMPTLPRVDKPDWWKRQSADSLRRWDARSVSRQRSEIRYRVALGLPLGGELDPDTIMKSFRRAAKRCQWERFDQLSSREQNLVAKQLEKYEMAAESLLEVSA